jgi:hypothetical protein
MLKNNTRLKPDSIKQCQFTKKLDDISRTLLMTDKIFPQKAQTYKYN